MSGDKWGLDCSHLPPLGLKEGVFLLALSLAHGKETVIVGGEFCGFPTC